MIYVFKNELVFKKAPNAIALGLYETPFLSMYFNYGSTREGYSLFSSNERKPKNTLTSTTTTLTIVI